ncbi:exported hypothetical protein [Candidatus Terasakiella magnetica]|uniref:Uncharacterized protein n=1 Tax=Candidatus Terasakiella magnetica TaxID=1867952 RepID=A0A1C3RLH8_9PROT|nr:hypothetical protein [Candidatus Terasakiella magnetica]SCA58134.1 exported hypothetical protein [Candidatus Terasakiella magnetica]
MIRFLTLTFLCIFAFSAFAQDQGNPDQTQYEELTVTLAEPLVIEAEKPATVKANFMEVIEKQDGNLVKRQVLGLQSVNIEGVLAPEAANQVRRDGTMSKTDLARIGGMITWNAVSLAKASEDGEEEVKRSLLPSPLQSTIESEGSSVNSGTAVSAKGDIQGAILTAQNLLDEKDQQKELLSEDKDEETDDPVQTPRVGGGSDDGGGTEGGNDLGKTGSYDIEPTEVEDIPAQGLTTEGCAPEPDFTTEKMVELNQFTHDGVPDGNCTPSGTTWDLKKGRASCPDVIEGDKAISTFRYYYMHPVDGQKFIDAEGDCRKDTDPDYIFDIVDDPSLCPNWREDMVSAEKKAYPQAKRVYRGVNNNLETVEDCKDFEDDTYKPVPITETTDICGIKDYFKDADGYSAQLSRYVYDKLGTTQQARGCIENGVTYPHEYDRTSCGPDENYSEGVMKYVKQIRKYIVTPEGSPYITPCEPDPNGSFDIKSTTTGCSGDNDFLHDVSGGTSLGTKKYYHLENGVQQWLKNGLCVADTSRSYDHNIEITGYEHKNEEKNSYPLTETYINTEFGKKIAESSRVKADATAIPYLYSKTEDRPTGTYSYEDCNKFADVATTEVWTNADNDDVGYPIGTGTPIGPENACQKFGGIGTTDWTLINDQMSYQNAMSSYVCGINTCRNAHVTSIRTCTYKATVIVTRDDGLEISSNTYDEDITHSTTQTRSASTAYFHSGYNDLRTNPGDCAPNPTAAKVAEWRAKYGY